MPELPELPAMPPRAIPAQPISSPAEDLALRRSTAAVAFAVAVIHLGLVPSSLHEATYLAGLFALGGMSCVVVAVQLWRVDDRTALVVGVAVCAGMVVGFVLSRTVGLPAYHATTWPPVALTSLVLEGLYLVLALVGPRRQARKPAGPKGADPGPPMSATLFSPRSGSHRRRALMARGPSRAASISPLLPSERRGGCGP